MATLTLRLVKGSELTHAEMDGNLTNLNNDIATRAPLASPALTGTPTAPTAAAGTNTTQLATTAFVTSGLSAKANLASPTFTGTPAAPTAAPGTNTTQLATTAFVTAAVAAGGGGGGQPADATLTALAGLTTAADQIIVATGADAFTMASLTAAARTLLDDTTIAAMRATLGLDKTSLQLSVSDGQAFTANQVVTLYVDEATSFAAGLAGSAASMPTAGSGTIEVRHRASRATAATAGTLLATITFTSSTTGTFSGTGATAVPNAAALSLIDLIFVTPGTIIDPSILISGTKAG